MRTCIATEPGTAIGVPGNGFILKHKKLVLERGDEMAGCFSTPEPVIFVRYETSTHFINHYNFISFSFLFFI
jgi:hypothetical protein